MTRIIAGSARGRRLKVPPGQTRPTADRVRESMFAALAHMLGGFDGARVLDLYAGSGALGLEAASRGAPTVVLVERDRSAASVARGNAAAVAVPGVRVVAAPVARFLAGPGRPFDLVLADPPYASPQVSVLVSTFAEDPFADMLCVEHASGVRFGLEPDWNRRYGDTALSIFFDPAEGAIDG